jgi:hypothetical protein
VAEPLNNYIIFKKVKKEHFWAYFTGIKVLDRRNISGTQLLPEVAEEVTYLLHISD